MPLVRVFIAVILLTRLFSVVTAARTRKLVLPGLALLALAEVSS